MLPWLVQLVSDVAAFPGPKNTGGEIHCGSAWCGELSLQHINDLLKSIQVWIAHAACGILREEKHRYRLTVYLCSRGAQKKGE